MPFPQGLMCTCQHLRMRTLSSPSSSPPTFLSLSLSVSLPLPSPCTSTHKHHFSVVITLQEKYVIKHLERKQRFILPWKNQYLKEKVTLELVLEGDIFRSQGWEDRLKDIPRRGGAWAQTKHCASARCVLGNVSNLRLLGVTFVTLFNVTLFNCESFFVLHFI